MSYLLIFMLKKEKEEEDLVVTSPKEGSSSTSTRARGRRVAIFAMKKKMEEVYEDQSIVSSRGIQKKGVTTSPLT